MFSGVPLRCQLTRSNFTANAVPVYQLNSRFTYIPVKHGISLRSIAVLENLSVWQIPVFRYGLLMRNQGYIEFETFEKQCCSYLRNIMTAIHYFLQTFRT
jgi:hypothetical protein